jgi:hypothetical protein
MFDRDEYWADSYDPEYYSRIVARCDRCEIKYDNLYQAVSDTAAAARGDGWQIDRTESGGYKWYCPKCKAAHDFEGLETAT